MRLKRTIKTTVKRRLQPMLERLKRLPLKPAYRRLRTRFMRLSERTRIALLVVAVVAGGLIVKNASVFLSHSKPEVAGITDRNGSVETGSNLTAPNYDTLLPEGKTIEQLGGWTRVSPSNRNPVFAYRDYIGETPINVSQQPLPDEFKDDTDADIAELAHAYHADDYIKTGGTTAYIGTSAKGPQSVILAKNHLLILIKSSVVISDKRWANYINSLR